MLLFNTFFLTLAKTCFVSQINVTSRCFHAKPLTTVFNAFSVTIYVLEKLATV